MNHTTMSLSAEANGKHANLSEAHRLELCGGSGLTLETIWAAGIHTESNRTTLAAILNRKSWPAAWGWALVFPYSDATGAIVLQRVKPSNPPRDAKTGKPRKYLQPSGVPNRAFIPAPTRAVLSDATARLVITEGEKKSLAATQAGFHCVGLCGVDCWHPVKSMGLIHDLAAIAWRGREAFICFDSDSATNENVERAERQLAAALAEHGAQVLIVRLPHAANGDKQGIDDFLVAHGAAEFQKLLEKASGPEPPDAGDLKGNAKDADPAGEAEYILAGCRISGLSRLRFWRGGWWWWRDGSYREKPPEETRAEVVNSMNERWLSVYSRTVGDVLEHLRAKSILSGDTDPGTWLGKSPHNWEAAECLATKSEVIHLPSLVSKREPFKVPACPAYFTTSAVDCQLDLQAPKPEVWLGFLDQLWNDDPQCIETLQEWFGYCLVPDTRQQKGLLIVGPPRGGKGVIGRTQTAIAGKVNIASPTLASLATNFGLSPMVGKTLAVISDARLSGRTDQVAVVERILSITGEDSITVDRKHQSPITCRLPTRFLILTNELPRLTDSSGAIISRFIMLRTTKNWLGREDRTLEDRIKLELPGILLWAIEGWRRLRERGYFNQPDSSLELLGELRDLASPVGAFYRDYCESGASFIVSKDLLFKAWKNWCETEGREKYTGTLANFGRELMAAVPTVKSIRPRVDGDRLQSYQGVKLKGDSWG